MQSSSRNNISKPTFCNAHFPSNQQNIVLLFTKYKVSWSFSKIESLQRVWQESIHYYFHIFPKLNSQNSILNTTKYVLYTLDTVYFKVLDFLVANVFCHGESHRFILQRNYRENSTWYMTSLSLLASSKTGISFPVVNL